MSGPIQTPTGAVQGAAPAAPISAQDARAVAAALGLQPGKTVEATVKAMVAQTVALLTVGGQEIAAETATPLAVGARLSLALERKNGALALVARPIDAARVNSEAPASPRAPGGEAAPERKTTPDQAATPPLARAAGVVAALLKALAPTRPAQGVTGAPSPPSSVPNPLPSPTTAAQIPTTATVASTAPLAAATTNRPAVAPSALTPSSGATIAAGSSGHANSASASVAPLVSTPVTPQSSAPSLASGATQSTPQFPEAVRAPLVQTLSDALEADSDGRAPLPPALRRAAEATLAALNPATSTPTGQAAPQRPALAPALQELIRALGLAAPSSTPTLAAGALAPQADRPPAETLLADRRPPDPSRTGQPSSREPAAALRAVIETLRPLAERAEAALSRPVGLDETAARPRPELGTPIATTEIAVRADPGTVPIPIAFWKADDREQGDGQRDADAPERRWTAAFTVSTPEAGAVDAEISLRAGRLSVRIAAERPEIAARLEAATPALLDALAASAFTVEGLSIGRRS